MAVATIGWPALVIAAESFTEEMEKEELMDLVGNMQMERPCIWGVHDAVGGAFRTDTGGERSYLSIATRKKGT